MRLLSMKSCFFIGHRDTPATVYSALSQAVEAHITDLGATRFIVGSYGAFDRMAARVVCEAKLRHPHITLTLLLPYHPSERPITLPTGFDQTYYPEGMETVPRRLAIVQANRFTVALSDFLIAYAWQPGSNALRLVEYAQKKGTAVTNLCAAPDTYNIQAPTK